MKGWHTVKDAEKPAEMAVSGGKEAGSGLGAGSGEDASQAGGSGARVMRIRRLPVPGTRWNSMVMFWAAKAAISFFMCWVMPLGCE